MYTLFREKITMKRVFFLCLLGVSLLSHAQNQKRPIGDELRNLDSRTIRIVEELDAYPLDQYFEKSEEAVRRDVKKYVHSGDGKAPLGIKIAKNGSIEINADKASQWVPAGYAIRGITSDLKRKPSRERLAKELIEKGFKKDDLVHLESFDENDPDGYEKKRRANLEHTVYSHPKAFLYLTPTEEQLDSVTDAEILDYINDLSDSLQGFVDDWYLDFLGKIHPHSRRVFMTIVYEQYLSDTVFYLHEPNNLENAKRFREEKLRIARKAKGGKQ